jgi:O-antigen/teichoic acid export membrane protein
MPSLKKNVTANYIGQFYVAFVGIIVLPLYLKYLGAEAYGLVGFYTLLQAWMQLLDLGISPTLGREVSRLKHSVTNAYQLRSVVRSLESVFLCIAVTSGMSLFLARQWISTDWLTVISLDPQLVAQCVGLMAVMVGLRWLASLYKSGINAFEQQVWMNLAEAIIVSLRFPGALVLLSIYPGQLLLFFIYQLTVAIVELFIVSLKFYGLLPRVLQRVPLFNPEELRRIAPFALGIAYTGGIWIFVTQLDKIILSRVLTLAEYGYFSLVATITGGILVMSSPVGKALLPRMTTLLAQNKESAMLDLYRRATRFVVCIIAPVTLVIAFFPEHVLYIWTADATAAKWASSVLPLYALGAGLLGVGAFPYYLQYAHGKLRIHVIYNTASVLIAAPLITYATLSYGPIGAAWVWVAFRLMSLTLWSTYVHHIFAPRVQLDWLLKDVSFPISSSCILLTLLHATVSANFPKERFEGMMAIGIMTVLTIALVLTLSFAPEIRERCRAKL